MHGGYGIYYDRMTLEIQSLERGLDGRALPIEVRAGNVFFLDPATGQFPPFAPSIANPFTGFILPGAGASGINIIDNGMQNPSVQQFNLGRAARAAAERRAARGRRAQPRHALHHRPHRSATVFNPVVGGPDRVVNLESSVNTQYDALLVSAEQRGARLGFRVGYTLAKALNYANDDQIPFANGPIDPQQPPARVRPDAERPAPPLHVRRVGRRSPGGMLVAPLWTIASAVPMDILMPDAQSRIPAFQRNAGGRAVQDSAADLNRALDRHQRRGRRRRRPAAARRRRSCEFGDRFQFARPAGVAAVHVGAACGSSRWWKCSTCST